MKKYLTENDATAAQSLTPAAIQRYTQRGRRARARIFRRVLRRWSRRLRLHGFRHRIRLMVANLLRRGASQMQRLASAMQGQAQKISPPSVSRVSGLSVQAR